MNERSCFARNASRNSYNVKLNLSAFVISIVSGSIRFLIFGIIKGRVSEVFREFKSRKKYLKYLPAVNGFV